MGSKKNDDLNNDSPVIFSYYAKIRGILIITIMCIYHIILYHDLPISLFDCMMMLWSTIGLTISLWAYYEMGRLYTFNIGIRGETNNDPNTKHKIIRSGPYKFVAHPGYTGQIMFLSGIILFCREKTCWCGSSDYYIEGREKYFHIYWSRCQINKR